ncbi:MAG: hypothetical protein ACLPVO_17875 [Desulfomonilaceae bacterium]
MDKYENLNATEIFKDGNYRQLGKRFAKIAGPRIAISTKTLIITNKQKPRCVEKVDHKTSREYHDDPGPRER